MDDVLLKVTPRIDHTPNGPRSQSVRWRAIMRVGDGAVKKFIRGNDREERNFSCDGGRSKNLQKKLQIIWWSLESHKVRTVHFYVKGSRAVLKVQMKATPKGTSIHTRYQQGRKSPLVRKNLKTARILGNFFRVEGICNSSTHLKLTHVYNHASIKSNAEQYWRLESVFFSIHRWNSFFFVRGSSWEFQ